MKLTLTKTQITALQNGATILILHRNRLNQCRENGSYSICDSYRYLKGHKDVWIDEEFCDVEYYDPDLKERRVYKSDSDSHMFDIRPDEWKQMTKEQSRYTIGEILDVRATTIKDIDMDDGFKMRISCPCVSEVLNHCNIIMQELNINRIYDNNDYVFLIEHGGLKNV